MKLLKITLAAIILLSGLLVLNACQVKSPLEDYTWTLTSYGSPGSMNTPVESTEITILFNSSEKTVSGSGGCNHYSGTYEVDGLDLTIGENIAVTEMWCGEAIGNQEHEYLNILAAANSFKLDHGNLIIYSGNQILNYTRQEE